MKYKLIIVLVICAMVLSLFGASAFALGYTGIDNSLAPGEYDDYIDRKTTEGRYAAVNTTEGYPNPGQLIGPSSLLWHCVHPAEGDWIIENGHIGKNSRSSVYIYDDLYSVGANYIFYIENDSSINATYGMTYSVNATY